MNPFRLYLVTDSEMVGAKIFFDYVIQAVKAGVTAVQLREKNISQKEFIAKGRELKKKLSPYKVPLIINDSLEVALACEADGVHLGRGDGCPLAAREALGANRWLGLSVEDPLQVQSFPEGSYDYLGVSGVFPSSTKPEITRHWSEGSLKMLKEKTQVSLIGIGGINRETLPQLKGWGLDGVAVVSAILSQKTLRQVSEVTRELKKDLEIYL